MSDFVVGALLVWCGFIIGNFAGDATTLRDCAVKGEALMFGGGVAVCTVRKESK